MVIYRVALTCHPGKVDDSSNTSFLFFGRNLIQYQYHACGFFIMSIAGKNHCLSIVDVGEYQNDVGVIELFITFSIVHI